MNRYFLLILLTSWSLLVTKSRQCETGVAFVNSVLSVPRSLMANADVAFLKTVSASTVERCMEECCSGRYGSCSVASFKRNATEENCLLFNCQPVHKCKFLSSNSTDSFSFSSIPVFPRPVPSNYSAPGASSTLKPKTTELQRAKEKIATYSEEQFAPKDDNTTIKPRKGVEEDFTADFLHGKSGIKPRKGVTLKDVPHSTLLPISLNKSNVKPRKGVGPNMPSPTEVNPHTNHAVSPSSQNKVNLSSEAIGNLVSDDLMSALAKVFEDEQSTRETSFQTHSSSKTAFTSSSEITTAISQADIYPTHTVVEPNMYHYSTLSPSFYSSKPDVGSGRISPEPSALKASSLETSSYVSNSQPAVMTATVSVEAASSVTGYHQASVSSGLPTAGPDVAHENLVQSGEETESERRYKSSMHLVLSLVFGLLVLFAVLGVVAKRIYDGWLRRDYHRMNYLIDGIYNGVD